MARRRPLISTRESVLGRAFIQMQLPTPIKIRTRSRGFALSKVEGLISVLSVVLTALPLRAQTEGGARPPDALVARPFQDSGSASAPDALKLAPIRVTADLWEAPLARIPAS